MPTRDEMITALRGQDQNIQRPSRDEMVSALRQQDEAGKAPKESPAVSAVRNLAQGATMNFSDEIAGGGEVIGRAIGLEGLGGPMRDIRIAKDGPTLDWEVLRDAYRNATKKEREALKKDLKDNPAVSVTANLAGAVLSPAAKIKAIQGASMAKSGAAIGGAAAAGASEADTLGGVVADTATGVVTGAALGKALDKAVPLAKKGAEKVGAEFKKFAEDRGAAALGATKALRKSIGKSKVMKSSRTALDEGVITPLSGPDKMAQRAKDLKDRGGKMMGEVYKQIDDAGESTFNPLDVAAKVDEKLGGFYRSPINRGESNQLENTLESILMRGDKNIPLSEAQNLKEELGKVANWKSKINITDKEKMAREAYQIVSDAIDEAAERGAAKLGIPGLKETLREGNRLYSAGQTASTLLDEKISQQGNNLFGLTDFITAGAGAGYGTATGDWETALAAVAAKKAGQKYGNQLLAKGSDAISKFLLSMPQGQQLVKSNPRAFRAAVVEFSKRIQSEKSLPKAASVPSELDQDSGVPAQEYIVPEKYKDQSVPPENYKRPGGAKEPKGRDKWAAQGLEKLQKHGAEGLDRAALMRDPKTKDLLVRASDLKPGTRAMQNLVKQLKARGGRG